MKKRTALRKVERVGLRKAEFYRASRVSLRQPDVIQAILCLEHTDGDVSIVRLNNDRRHIRDLALVNCVSSRIQYRMNERWMELGE